MKTYRAAIFDHSKHANGQNPFVYFTASAASEADFFTKLRDNHPPATNTYLTIKIQ